MVKDKLIPYTESHSISEVIFSLFLVQPLIKPERFEKIFQAENNTLQNYFQEFKPIISQEFGFTFNNENSPTVDPRANKIVGFEFRKFAEGKLKKVFNLNNEPNPILAIHDLEYSRWAVFYPEIDKIINGFKNFDSNMYIRGIGISYVDQFTWNDKNYPDIKSIFKSNKYLPEIIFESKNNLNFSTNHTRVVEDCLYSENINVNINRITKGSFNISIIHNAIENIIDFKSLDDLFKDNFLKECSTKVHNLNKDLLKTILQDDVLSLINLK